MAHHFHSHIFREYDIRGTFGVDLSEADAYEIGLRLATLWYNPQQTLVCVGRDGRLSSPVLTQALIAGLTMGGMDVVDIGLGPTPLLYYATKISPAVAGVMVTGSHNPANDNGFKIVYQDKPFFAQDLQKILSVAPKLAEFPGHVEELDLKPAYLLRLTEDVLNLKGSIKVAWDPGNGATGEIVSELTHFLAGSHVTINTQIDGTFPSHHPDPSIMANMKQLQELVLQKSCEIGIAFDGDGDRLGVVDNKGRLISGDQLLALFAQDFLKENQQNHILADVKCGRVFFDIVKQGGGTPLMTKTGHSNLKNEMPKLGVLLAGEMSGHYFFADRYYGFDDALYAALRLLTLLSKTDKTLADLIDELPHYFSLPEQRHPCPEDKKEFIITQLKAILQRENIAFLDIDGIRVESEQGWWLVRASQTGPYLTTRCEGVHQAGLNQQQSMLDKYLNLLIPS